MHKRGATLAHQLREAMAAVRNLRLRLWDARPEWVDLEAAADHGSLGVARLPCDRVHRGGLVQALHVGKLSCNEDRRGTTVQDVARLAWDVLRPRDGNGAPVVQDALRGPTDDGGVEAPLVQ